MLLVLIGVILGLLVDTTTYLRKQMAEGNPERVVGKWISNNKNKFPSKKLIVSGGYYTDNLPVISTGIAQYAYWAKGDWALLSGRSLTYNDVLNSMNRHNATVFIYDGGTPSKCPTFDNNWEKNFILVKDFKKLGIKVLRLKE